MSATGCTTTHNSPAATVAPGISLEKASLAGDEVIRTPIGEIALIDSYFNDDASRRLFDEMDYQRAVQSYLWSHPLVSMTAWRDRQAKAYGVTGETDFVVLKSLKEKRGIVTGNLTTPYILNFISLKKGPLEISYPAGQTAGGILDFWQRPVVDLGLTGPDRGKGGRYVVVGPEDDAKKYERPGLLRARTTWFYEAVTSTEGMVNPKVGAGQVYMTAKRDSQGELLRADKTYRLRVPKDVPVGQFWALTLYSENTRRPYDNGGTEIRSVNLDSQMKDLKVNADGSIDLYVGAKAPAGYENNFMKTVGDDGWFVYFRLYAPLQPFFDKSFALPDFERIE